jgi:hypothetical protein
VWIAIRLFTCIDEFQFTCKKHHIASLVENIERCVTDAGEFFKMACPLASDSATGSSWFHTH